mgnify:CR=1 FL=1
MKKTKIRRTISVRWLRSQGASCSEIEHFQREFGESAKLTLPNLLRAAELRLDLHWLATHLLPVSLNEDYLKKRYSLYEEYWKKLDSLYGDYLKKLAILIWDIVSSASR